MRQIAVLLACAALVAACQTTNSPTSSSASAPASQTSSTRLPTNLTVPASAVVVAPGPEVPAEYAAFSGKWGGYWGGELPSILVVEQISPDGRASGIYIWGDHPSGRIQSGSSKFRAMIENGILKWGNNVQFEFRRAGDELLGERYNRGAQQGAVTMRRMS